MDICVGKKSEKRDLSLKKSILWGAAGHAKVLRSILEFEGYIVTAVFDNFVTCSPFEDVPFLGGWKDLEQFREQFLETAFVVAIGGENGRARVSISEGLMDAGLSSLTMKHFTCHIAKSASLGEGCQLLAMSAVCEEARIGSFTIINTNATVDHECRIGRGVHVMPGATIAGCVIVDDFATIGSNATILPRLKIGSGAFVGAGSVVTRNVPAGAVVVGAPARVVKYLTPDI